MAGDYPVGQVSEVWVWLAAHRRTRRRGAVDWYVAGFAAVLAGVTLASALSKVAVPLVVMSAAGAGWLPGVIALLANGAALVAWLWGPLTVPGPELWWVFSSGLDRAELLSRPYARLAVISIAVGVVIGGCLWVVCSPEIGWVVAAALAPVSGIAAALVHQQNPDRHVLPLATIGLPVLLVLANSAWVMVTGLLVMAAASGAYAWRGLGEMSRYALSSAGRSADGVRGSLLGGDSGLLLDLVVLRTMRPAVGRLQGAGAGWPAMAWIDMQRLASRHRWLVLAGVAATDAVSLAMAAVAPHGVLWSAALLMPLLASTMSMRRRLALSPGLRRVLPVGRALAVASASGAIAVAMGNTIVLVVLFTLVARSALQWALLTALLLNGAALVGAWRMATARAPDFSTGLLATDAGVIPVGALLTMARGWDLLLATLVVLQLH